MEGRHVPTPSAQIDGSAAKQAGMKAATAARLAWALCVACLVGLGTSLLLQVLNGTAGLGSTPLPAVLTFTVVGALFAVVGALVASRQPGNKVGWLLLAAGLCLAVSLFGGGYARYALLTDPKSLPGGIYGAWMQVTLFGMVAILAIFLPLYFPTGRLLSPRWRPILWAGIGYLFCAVVGNNLQPGPEDWLPDAAAVRNPVVYLPAIKPLLDVILALSAPCFLVGIAGAVAALVVRFRRSRGIERQQLKWFTYAAALAPLPSLAYEMARGIWPVLLVLILPLVPISVGIAILRYRLYEIDRIINRTLVYGLLTAILGLCYAAGSLLFVLVAGAGKEPPSWLVAAATLAAAAVFRPGRRRIQGLVDRRFNRRKYDAAKTVEAFSVRLRDEVDLDALSAELLAVADQTMQPTTASLWLRPSPPVQPRG
jgi:uncharacterized membrane protein